MVLWVLLGRRMLFVEERGQVRLVVVVRFDRVGVVHVAEWEMVVIVGVGVEEARVDISALSTRT